MSSETKDRAIVSTTLRVNFARFEILEIFILLLPLTHMNSSILWSMQSVQRLQFQWQHFHMSTLQSQPHLAEHLLQ